MKLRLVFPRKNRMTMATGLSMVCFVLAGSLFYSGIFVSARPLPSHVFPASLDMAGAPSESILAAYGLQSVASDAAECSQIGK
jgi:hypothetical protein